MWPIDQAPVLLKQHRIPSRYRSMMCGVVSLVVALEPGHRAARAPILAGSCLHGVLAMLGADESGFLMPKKKT